MYIDYCRMMTGDQGMISYEDFSKHEYAMITDILQVRSELNDKIKAEMDNQQKNNSMQRKGNKRR